MRRSIILTLGVLLSCDGTPPPESLLQPLQRTAPRNDTLRRVVRVIDGDTIELEDGVVVRYIGIDTPERGRPFYQEAKDLNASLVHDEEVRLEMDVEPYDRYHRLLAYVWKADLLVNAEIVRRGLAYCSTHPPNVAYAERFLQNQREARETERGFWKESFKGNEPYYLASDQGHAFHRPTCNHARKISRRFKDRLEALDAGLSPCRTCDP